MLGVIARAAADCHPQTLRMRKVPMAALAAPVHKPDFFQVGNQLSQFARHFSIKVVSQRFAVVNDVQISRATAFFSRRREVFRVRDAGIFDAPARSCGR